MSESLLRADEDFTCGVAFHAQQAAEKFLKAALVWHQIEFPKTHDIARIVELLESAPIPPIAGAQEAIALTIYGVDARYPSDLTDPGLDEARRALAIASSIRSAVLSHLPAHLHPPDPA